MKKFMITLLLSGFFMGFSSTVKAQENYGNVANALLKIGSDAKIAVNYEFQIIPNLTVGPEVSIPLNFNYILMGARADYYFDSLMSLTEPWDLYAGIDAGFIFDGNNSFEFNGHIGTEYKFHEHWGGIAEIAFGTSTTGGIGVAYHF